MKTNIDTLFSLLKNALFGTAINEETKKATIDNIDKIYALAKHHDIAHLVSFAIERNNIQLPQTELTKKLKKRHPIAVIRYEAANQTLCDVCETFEREGVEFIPLKGSVIRDYYPEPWMRTSCDIDVLVREEDLARASDILVDICGYKKTLSGTHDVAFSSTNGTNVELHYKLSEIYFENPAEEMLENAWDYAYAQNRSKYHRVLADEFFYLFHVYHMAKHFEGGGCGIRPFIDLWILDNKVDYDKNKRDEMLEQSGLLRFAECCRELAEYWLSDGQESEMLLNLQNYILMGGVYGTRGNKNSVVQAKNDNRFKHTFDMIFLSYDKLKIQYPVIKKHKWLIPFCQVSRWCRIFKPGYGKIANNELIVPAKARDENSENMSQFLKQIGLK